MKRALLALGLVFVVSPGAFAAEEEDGKILVAKSGETIDVREVYGAKQCKSFLIATPEVEVLQAPPGVTLSVREDEVTPKNCKEKIKGGYVVAKVGEVKEAKEGKLIFRVKYKSKDGVRPIGYSYRISLVP